jgi:hypothetical protein
LFMLGCCFFFFLTDWIHGRRWTSGDCSEFEDGFSQFYLCNLSLAISYTHRNLHVRVFISFIYLCNLLIWCNVRGIMVPFIHN